VGVSESVTIEPRFNGPPESANGGYTCGLVAGLIDADEASVSLRLPPPVGRPLDILRDDGRVELRDGDALVAEGTRAELLMEVPEPVSPGDAAAASAAGHDHWCDHHPFPTCFACGPHREPGDGLCLVPGPLRDGLFAAHWKPHESLDDGTGHVRPECVWAALDCPTSAPVANFETGPAMVLARLTARLGGSVLVGEEHSILSWPVAVEGRKRHGACALFDSAGRLLCTSQALWIEVRPQ
jgi:hypothetical protein